MIPPTIDNSTRQERIDYVHDMWQCMNNCELCGKCHILKGRDIETLYSDYIEGNCSYLDVTLKLRK